MTPDERFGPRGGPSNETHLRQILLWLAATPAAGDPSSYVYAFGYECGRSGCEERVPTIVRAYERLVGRGGALLSHPNHGALSTH